MTSPRFIVLAASRVHVRLFKNASSDREEGQAVYARLSSSSEIARTTACASNAKSSDVGVRTTVGRFSSEYFL